MLNITPQMQLALGSAVMLIEDDVLYITNAKGWMLVIPSPSAHIPHQVLNLVRDFDTRNRRVLVDWRILNAKDVDFPRGTFLPHRARKHADIGLSTSHAFAGLVSSNLQEVAEKTMMPSITGDLVDLTAMFAAGEARAVYATTAKKQKESNRAFAKEPMAETYKFQFDDKLIAVQGAQLRAFIELGFSLVCPKASYGQNTIPPMGLLLNGGYEVFGYCMPMSTAGVFEDKLGRKLISDASAASWLSENDAVTMLTLHEHYSFARDGSLMHLADVLEETYRRDSLRLAVTSLMWKEWTVEDIDTVYESMRGAAYRTRAGRIQEETATIVKELTDGEIKTWRVRNHETSLSRFCLQYERMSQVVDLDLGLIPRACELLEATLAEM